MKLGRSRRIVAVAASTFALVAATVAVTSTATASTAALDYVALGDSSAAGPLVPLQEASPCLRSSKNWPKVVAAELGADVTDVTCSGATTDDLSGKQFGFVAPQYDALKPDTDLVTIAIGANDISLGTVVPSCINPLPKPAGSSCKRRYTAGGTDQLVQRIAAAAPKVGAALDEIAKRSPQADVYVVGYGTYWQKGGCHPRDPIWDVDADYLQSSWDKLHAMLADQAAAHGAEYVDIREPSAAHGVCASYRDKWMEGLLPTSAAAPYHPNAKGMAHSGATVAAAITATTDRQEQA